MLLSFFKHKSIKAQSQNDISNNNKKKQTNNLVPFHFKQNTIYLSPALIILFSTEHSCEGMRAEERVMKEKGKTEIVLREDRINRRASGGEDWFLAFWNDDSVQHANDAAPQRDLSP